MKIAPSMLSADFNRLAEDIAEIESYGVEYLHIDVMDGTFVPNISFGAMIFAGLRAKSQMVFDCHMMVDNPVRYIGDMAKAGADIITIHAEATKHLHSDLQAIKALGVKAGVSINPGTSVEVIRPVLSIVDLVLVMTVNPGFGGQSFIPECVEKIELLDQLRKERQDYHYEIEVDGGVNDQTGRQCLEAGADVLVAGSYIFKHPDRRAAVDSLRP